jgi:signal transduction histidine kinase
VIAAGEHQERLIEALLTLARSQRGLESREPVDLGAIASGRVEALVADGVRVDAELTPAPTEGDPALIERLVANLLDNAVHHNLQHGGWLRIWTGLGDGGPTVKVSNSGPLIAPDEVDAMLEPFRRLNGDRRAGVDGLGLGLSIVAAIAAAHGAALRATPRADGGLDIEIAFCPGPAESYA